MTSEPDIARPADAMVPSAPPLTPAIDQPPATHQSETSSPIDAWVQGMIRTQNELSRDSTLRNQVSKRGF